MVSAITDGIEICVETFYQADFSKPVLNEYMFAYRVTIENHNDYSVKLLNRHWKIFDSNGENKIVNGEGVIGEQPVINKGEQYNYVSGCNLKSEMGKMVGNYEMQNLNNMQLFTVNIPEFELIAPQKNN
jgi:ApaG protein